MATFLEYVGLATVAFIAAWIGQLVYHTFLYKANLTQYKSKDGWALVTGCTGGIGEGFAQELAARGFNVLLVGRSEKKLKELQATLKAQSPSVKTAYAVSDATKSDEANIGPVVDAAAKVNLRLLINNVGVSTEHSAPYSETSAEDIAAMIAVNCTYGTVLTQKLVPLMTKNGAGAIINVSSQSAWFHVPHLAVYSATKAFNLAFSNALRAELVENNIDVLALTPGFVATAMTRMRPSSMVPTARRCASDALDKIGLRSHCGFWAHELTLRFGMLFPADWRGAMSLAGMKKANEARLRKAAKMAAQAKTQ